MRRRHLSAKGMKTENVGRVGGDIVGVIGGIGWGIKERCMIEALLRKCSPPRKGRELDLDGKDGGKHAVPHEC